MWKNVISWLGFSHWWNAFQNPTKMHFWNGSAFKNPHENTLLKRLGLLKAFWKVKITWPALVCVPATPLHAMAYMHAVRARLAKEIQAYFATKFRAQSGDPAAFFCRLATGPEVFIFLTENIFAKNWNLTKILKIIEHTNFRNENSSFFHLFLHVATFLRSGPRAAKFQKCMQLMKVSFYWVHLWPRKFSDN